MDRLAYIHMSPKKKAVLEWVKDALDNGILEEEDLPVALNYSTRPTLSVQGWKKAVEHD